MQLALSDIRQSIPQVDWKPLGIPALVLLIIAMVQQEEGEPHVVAAVIVSAIKLTGLIEF